jgi:hypothetical protein
MAAHDHFRFHENQHSGPSRPEPSQGNPKQLIPSTQSSAWVLTFEHAYLLAQGNKLKPEIISRAKEAGEPPEEIQRNPKHPKSLTLLVITAGRSSS